MKKIKVPGFDVTLKPYLNRIYSRLEGRVVSQRLSVIQISLGTHMCDLILISVLLWLNILITFHQIKSRQDKTILNVCSWSTDITSVHFLLILITCLKLSEDG